MFNLLEGDGIIESIYHLLWTKDSVFNIDPYVVIPDTILYKYSKPCYWYFSSKTDLKLKKKIASNLNNNHIKEKFVKGYNKEVGIIAYFIYKKSNKSVDNIKNNNNKNITNYNLNQVYSTTTKTINNFYESNNKTVLDNEGLIIEYFTKEELFKYLDNKMPCDEGVLQKFEIPKGNNNFTIRVNWTPKMCLFEKKINLKNIYDKKSNIYEKAVTYEGYDFQTLYQPLRGSNIPDRLEKISNSIASHISNISLERIKITRMILNYKITKEDKIILLWCSHLRLDNSLDKNYKDINNNYNIANLNKIKISTPDDVNLFKISSKITKKEFNIDSLVLNNKTKSLSKFINKNSKCINCESIVNENHLYSVSYRILVEAHENRKRDSNFFKEIVNNYYTSSGVEIIPYIENNNSNNNFNNNISSSIHNISKDINKSKGGSCFDTNKNSCNKILPNANINSTNRFNKNMLIPKVILENHPKLRYDIYSKLKSDEVFLSKTSRVCERCFMDITRYCNLGGTNIENIIRNLKNKALPTINPKNELKVNINNINSIYKLK